MLKSTAFIVTVPDGGNGIGCGSGSLVHGPKKLVLTNYHVVGGSDRVLVFFPAYDAKKELITSPVHYFDNMKRIATRATVLARSSRLDLAVLELETVPSHIIGLPLAAKPAPTGSTVYSLGGSGVNLRAFTGAGGDSGALWRFTSGTVRGRHRETYQYKDGQKVEAMILETQSPINPGDSGGPAVNDRGELVGVVASTSSRDRLVSQSIDLAEAREYLQSAAKDHNWTWNDETAAPQVPPDPTMDVSPAVLITRAKAGTPVQRIEAIDQLGRLGDQARIAVPDLIALLDDAEDGVRQLAADALDRIGPPAPADAVCIPRALSGAGKNARLYALKHYSKTEAGSEQLPLIVKALDDSELPVRDRALSALEKFGAGCKSAAFPTLLNRLLDPDAAFAARVTKVLVGFAPYDGAERRILVESLGSSAWQRRRLAVVLLAPGAPDESTACLWFEPLIKDVSAEVRAVALPALAKWPGAMKRLQSTVVGLIRDDHPGIRAAAIRALGENGTGHEVKTALLGVAGPGASADLRDLALQSLLKLEYTDPKADLPILVALLKVDDAKIKVATYSKAAGLKEGAKDLLPQADEGLKHTDAAVQTAALKLVGAVGAEAASFAPRVAALVLATGTKPAEAVQVQAVETLVLLGPASKDHLLEAIVAPLPPSVVKRVCDALGRKGTEVPAKTFPQLFLLADRSEELRPALADLVGRIGGDEIVRLCAERTYWSFKTLGNGKKVKDCKYELAVQVWAIEAMGKMDPKSMTEKGRAMLIERMQTLPKTNPDAECKKAAESASVKLTAAGLGSKP